MRELPDVALTPCPEGHARLLAQGFDTVQEAFALRASDQFRETLDALQAQAKDLDPTMEATVITDLAGSPFHVHATGAKGGVRWRLDNDDFILMISKRDEWGVSVRYTSAGLWEHGVDALRARAFQALRPYTTRHDDDAVRVSRADWCFDFYSPKFFTEFKPGLARNVVCHSSAKTQEHGSYDYGLWARGGRGETLTIGSKTGLQVEAYNKTLEIDEKSGKTWLYPVWLQGLQGEWVWPTNKPDNVVRVECRFASDYLKERNIRRPHELAASMPELLAEALYTRRLCSPALHHCPTCGHGSETDNNRWRWPMHWLWSAAVEARAAGHMLPHGRVVTGRRDALVDAAVTSLAGNLRTMSVLKNGNYDAESVKAIVREAQDLIEQDREHAKKILIAQNRYSEVEEAR